MMASVFRALPVLRRAAPNLSRELFTCRTCSTKATASLRSKALLMSNIPRNYGIRWNSTQAIPSQAVSQHGAKLVASKTGTENGAKEGGRATSRVYPQTSDKLVAYWLLGSAASVFGIVVFGGLTRLTESGLSITEWRPVTGSLPPMSAEKWESEFTKYRASPEFHLLNPNMTLEEFKKIYWMEWTHRVWGRAIGITFLLPTAYFILRRRVAPHMAWKLVGICGLIGFQGVIGWWMVKSGLKDELFAPGSHPRVSQIRLTVHLGAAFAVYAAMLRSGLSILREHGARAASPEEADKLVRKLLHPRMRVFRGLVGALTLLIFATAMSGALVAGLDAGLIYNEFPYMGVGLAPPKSELFDPRYSRIEGQSDLVWRNVLENPSLVQLDHRALATTTFSAIMALWCYARFGRSMRAVLPHNACKGVTGLVHLAWVQVTLGISTLLYLVPTWLAAAHQAGSLALLTGALVLSSRVGGSARVLSLLRQRARLAAKHNGKSVADVLGPKKV
ncbi:electron transfer protein 1, mitochondrial precursor [Lineolata rhizophorae]|uniref:Electron transfer protein 1, mitochondrial n=1 Tax=Lineolata rhizophorae TaxID=578093 RepID=A0A6A6NPR0_9PEZI|nr:electron transfer protein 1, mitochondrial precursor [Lineolata rhizophorae]